MKKIQSTNNTSTMTIKKQNRNELKRHYTINVASKDNGFQARVTLKVIGGGKNPRITAYSGISEKDAVCKILDKMAEKLSEYKKMNLLRKEICLNIYDSIMISIQELRLTTDTDVMKSATTVFQILTVIDNTTIPPTLYSQVNVSQNNNQLVQSNNVFQNQPFTLEEQNQLKPVTSKDFETVALEWFRYKLSLTSKNMITLNL